MEFSINSLTFVEGSEEKGQRFERFFVVGPTGRICSIKVPLNDDGTVHVKHINGMLVLFSITCRLPGIEILLHN
jgi:hypothetical protein